MNDKLLNTLKKFFKRHFPELEHHIEYDFNKVKVKEGGFVGVILKLFKVRGICLFRRIYYVKGSIKDSVQMAKFLAHELTHTIQYRREGVLSFIVKYIVEALKKGYSGSEYEEEAVYYEKLFIIWCKGEKISL